MKQFPVPVRGCVISAQNYQALFQFGENKLHNPHDIVVLPDGKTVYIVEIGPFKSWKYQSSMFIFLNLIFVIIIIIISFFNGMTPT